MGWRQVGVGGPHLQDVDDPLAHLGERHRLVEGRAALFFAADLDLDQEVLAADLLDAPADGQREAGPVLHAAAVLVGAGLVIGERNLPGMVRRYDMCMEAMSKSEILVELAALGDLVGHLAPSSLR